MTSRRRLLCAAPWLAAAPAWALYDAAPETVLAAAQGEWRGTLTYADYSQKGRQVSLPTRLFSALAAPDTLVLHYVFDDGPAKTVYSYEQMRFNFAASEVRWASGWPAKETVCRIVARSRSAAGEQIIFERDAGSGRDRYTLDISAAAFVLAKTEVQADGSTLFRNRYEFRR